MTRLHDALVGAAVVLTVELCGLFRPAPLAATLLPVAAGLAALGEWRRAHPPIRRGQ